MENKLTKISEAVWELPKSFKKGMKVPVRVIGSKKLVEELEEVVFEQASNVACLPGLVGQVIVLPDAHSGYGAPIGSVFAVDPRNGGIISPGAVGYDINCGVRLISTNLTKDEVKPRIRELVDKLFNFVPAGLGRQGFLSVSYNELDEVLAGGARWIVDKGFGWQDDLEHIEEGGAVEGANPDKISRKAKERGKKQLATLGSGNHYLEIQKVEKIFDRGKASEWGIFEKDQIVVMLHCGSRGLGHQVAGDYLRIFSDKLDKYRIKVPDRQLVCAPFNSNDGQNYYQAMAGAANFAYANRQAITFQIREVFEKVFGKKAQDLGMKLVYDVCHNIARVEKQLIVHRKGATRSFPDRPVIIGGSMETGSYLLCGTEEALKLSFGSTAHGSGRTMSRHKAKRLVHAKELSRKLIEKEIIVRSASYSGLAEEAGVAYKNIHEVVKSVEEAGISTPVASFKPMGNIKG